MNHIKVSPSEFAFMYDSCKRCWWLKANHRLLLGTAFPAIFNHIDSAMKQGVTVDDLNRAGIPAKKIVRGERSEWVESAPFEHAGTALTILGKRDLTIELEDGTLGIVDYKTTHPNPETVHKYARQLHAYEYAMTYPKRSEPREVGGLWLYCFSPFKGRFKTKDDDASLIGKVMAVPVEFNRIGFQVFLEELCELASSPMPQPDANCQACLMVEMIVSVANEQMGAA